MTLAVGFFDESADGTQSICYTVAGFVGSNEATAILELRWRDLLTQFNLKYFKASELHAGDGEFKQFRDDPKGDPKIRHTDEERRKLGEIKRAFTDVILKCDGVYGIGAAMMLRDCERIKQEYPDLKTFQQPPYYLCVQNVLVEVGTLVAIENRGRSDIDKGWIRPIFDSHEEYGPRLREGYEAIRQKNPISQTYVLPPCYENDQTYLGLQAADNLAFEIRQYATGRQENRTERVPLTMLRPRVRMAYDLSYPALKLIAENQDPNFDPLAPLKYTLDDIIGDKS
jgi:hypothetical protein